MTDEERARFGAVLSRITWHALTGHQAHFAAGTDTARRYATGFSPILGFADPERPDFDALRPHCAPGEHFYTDGWSGPAPAGWLIEAESTMFKMVWEGAPPAPDDESFARPLGPADADAAIALATLTKPGPFGPRTIEFGEYLGVFEGGQLVAMAGERMAALPLHEISGVCTHPGCQGRGLAKRLMLALIRHQLARGEIPFLHVMRDNPGARGLYERMGFRAWAESVVRVVVPQ
jgi:ribosomal protein S18 acetylase RimI-like enzyme